MPSTRIKHPEWIASHEPTNYPFEDDATLVNDEGDILFPGTFLDAAFHPVGGQARMYVSRITITSTQATIVIGDRTSTDKAFGTFELAQPPDQLRFVDSSDRPAGLIVSDTIRMSIFQSWSVGDHEFLLSQTALVAACCMPQPEIGVRGIQLDDGSVLTGDVYIVGDEGVVLSCEEVEVDGECDGVTEMRHTIRVDIVGDPLWRRRECAPGFFTTPQFLQTITFQKGASWLKCGPGQFGDLKVVAGNTNSEDTILRVRPAEAGLIIEAVGEKLEDVR